MAQCPQGPPGPPQGPRGPFLLYFGGKNINEKVIRKLFDNINPSFIIGPFRREILLDIKPLAKRKSIPVLTFSNDTSLREKNIWTLGFSPEEQVRSVISCALSHGYKNFGLIVPDNLYGKVLINASIDLLAKAFSIRCSKSSAMVSWKKLKSLSLMASTSEW